MVESHQSLKGSLLGTTCISYFQPGRLVKISTNIDMRPLLTDWPVANEMRRPLPGFSLLDHVALAQ